MITKNSVVSFSYLLKNSEGQKLDFTTADAPHSYLHGHKQIVPGLEIAMEGLKVGDKKDVQLTVEESYGEVNPDLRLKMPREKFPPEMKIAPGLQFEANVGDKNHIFTVVSEEDSAVNIDGNHPLAGQALHFAVEVLEIRDATAEEISHGHAHGEHGHSH
jgi:FKBP-type peptidyl-prolyl cis-trans isomerase SlyD